MSRPTHCYTWNGEITLDSAQDGATEGNLDEELALDSAKTFTGSFVGRRVLLRRLPADAVDALSVDLNVKVSAAVADNRTLHDGSKHWLHTLSCQWSPAEPHALFVALEHCDGNLSEAVDTMRELVMAWRSGEEPVKAPALPLLQDVTTERQLRRVCRSICQQLCTAVVFLHEGVSERFSAIYHNNLKPSNVLFRNDVLLIAELRTAAPLRHCSTDEAHSTCSCGEGFVRDGKVHGGWRSEPSGWAVCPDPLPWSHRAPRRRKRSSSSSRWEEEALQAVLEANSAAEKAGLGPADSVQRQLRESAADVLGDLAHGGTEASQDATYRDSFALGCLLFYVLTLGKHPYGGVNGSRTDAILRPSRPDLRPLQQIGEEEAAHLVAGLIHPDPHKRFVIDDALLQHVFFWSRPRKFRLLVLLSEGLSELRTRNPPPEDVSFANDIQDVFSRRLGSETWSAHFTPPPSVGGFQGSWDQVQGIHTTPQKYESSFLTKYNMYAMVRYLRNLYVHGNRCLLVRHEQPALVRTGLYDSLRELEDHIWRTFPWLFLELWRIDVELHGGRFTSIAWKDVEPGAKRPPIRGVHPTGSSATRQIAAAKEKNEEEDEEGGGDQVDGGATSRSADATRVRSGPLHNIDDDPESRVTPCAIAAMQSFELAALWAEPARGAGGVTSSDADSPPALPHWAAAHRSATVTARPGAGGGRAARPIHPLPRPLPDLSKEEAAVDLIELSGPSPSQADPYRPMVLPPPLPVAGSVVPVSASASGTGEVVETVEKAPSSAGSAASRRPHDGDRSDDSDSGVASEASFQVPPRPSLADYITDQPLQVKQRALFRRVAPPPRQQHQARESADSPSVASPAAARPESERNSGDERRRRPRRRRRKRRSSVVRVEASSEGSTGSDEEARADPNRNEFEVLLDHWET